MKYLKVFENFLFHEIEKSKKDKMYILLNFMGGDGDIYIDRYIDMNGIKFSTYKDQIEEINHYILLYETMRDILQRDNDRSSIQKEIRNRYSGVLSKFGEELMGVYSEEVPTDPTGGDYKCSIRKISLIGYDLEGNKHESVIWPLRRNR